MDKTSQIRPWVRADCYMPNAETRALVPPPLREHYDMVISDVGRTSVALSEAQGIVYAARADYEVAHVALAAFFNGLVNAEPNTV